MKLHFDSLIQKTCLTVVSWHFLGTISDHPNSKIWLLYDFEICPWTITHPRQGDNFINVFNMLCECL